MNISGCSRIPQLSDQSRERNFASRAGQEGGGCRLRQEDGRSRRGGERGGRWGKLFHWLPGGR